MLNIHQFVCPLQTNASVHKQYNYITFKQKKWQMHQWFFSLFHFWFQSPSNVKYGMTNGLEQQCKAQARGPLLLSNDSRASRAAPIGDKSWTETKCGIIISIFSINGNYYVWPLLDTNLCHKPKTFNFHVRLCTQGSKWEKPIEYNKR